MLVRSLSWNILILWRLGCRKVSFTKRLRSHGHFASFDNIYESRQNNIDTSRGGVRVFVLYSLGKLKESRHVQTKIVTIIVTVITFLF